MLVGSHYDGHVHGYAQLYSVPLWKYLILAGRSDASVGYPRCYFSIWNFQAGINCSDGVVHCLSSMTYLRILLHWSLKSSPLGSHGLVSTIYQVLVNFHLVSGNGLWPQNLLCCSICSRLLKVTLLGCEGLRAILKSSPCLSFLSQWSTGFVPFQSWCYSWRTWRSHYLVPWHH